MTAPAVIAKNARLAGVFLFCFSTALTCWADTFHPDFLIKRMIAATSALNYEGVFVYHRGNQIDSMRIIHKLNGDTELERLVSLSGPAREVIRKGDEVKCLFEDDKEVMVEKIEPKDFFSFGLKTPIEDIAAHYRLQIAGRARIAGREAVLISIVPASSDRFAYQLAVDTEHGLLLKSAVYGRDRRVLEQVQFAAIAIGHDIALSEFNPQIGGDGYTWYTSERAVKSSNHTRDGQLWAAQWLPDGFKMRNEMTQRFADVTSPVSHLVYTDGLAMVSIFIEEDSPRAAPAAEAFSSLGAVSALSVKQKNHLITVVGELPPPTLQRIAASVGKID